MWEKQAGALQFGDSLQARKVTAGRAVLRAREIAFALAMGALGAGGAALILASDEVEQPAAAAASERPTYEVAPFESISTVGPQDVVVSFGESLAVRADGPPEVLERLEAVSRDGVLTIQPKAPFRAGFRWMRFNSATFYVTLPRLEAVSLAGSGDVRVERVEGERFSASVVGPGKLSIAALAVDEADLSVAGSGDLVAAGTARHARVSIAGSGEIRAEPLRSQTAAVTIGGSGDAALTVDGEARVSIMGSGDVTIEGEARCTVSRFGSGDVRCGSSGD